MVEGADFALASFSDFVLGRFGALNELIPVLAVFVLEVAFEDGVDFEEAGAQEVEAGFVGLGLVVFEEAANAPATGSASPPAKWAPPPKSVPGS